MYSVSLNSQSFRINSGSKAGGDLFRQNFREPQCWLLRSLIHYPQLISRDFTDFGYYNRVPKSSFFMFKKFKKLYSII